MPQDFLLDPPTIGDNNPPAEDALSLRTDQLVTGADTWAEKVAEIADEDTAKRAADFLEQLAKHGQSLEEERTRLRKPLQDQLQAIQDRFVPLQQRVKACITIIKGRLDPWLDKLKKKQQEEAAEAKRRADEAAAEAQRKLEESRQHKGRGTVEAIVAAEQAQQEAKIAATDARRAAKAKPQARGDFTSKALSQRTTWSARIVDKEQALIFLQDESEITEALQRVANRLAREKHDKLMVPGLEAVSTTGL